ncbi:UNKNOWN [Stylonychia lemnae]|uniref:Uncharacterized protein n=1 Tax=Stylonychia lemnae TaxID=5949 RepID=A0A077ZZQ8_STYLE|nr:UNKNOWN [Stylonychia lemnae]|eukprot:CDW75416.1 UNKNOWN [Stylonychia lemnae]
MDKSQKQRQAPLKQTQNANNQRELRALIKRNKLQKIYKFHTAVRNSRYIKSEFIEFQAEIEAISMNLGQNSKITVISYFLKILGRRESFSVTRNSALGRNVRSASQDIFHRPNSTSTFWQSMVSMQRVNKWDGNYSPNERARDRSAPVGLAAIGQPGSGGFGKSAPAFGGNRSTTRSVSKGAGNNDNDYGIWGKKSTQEYYQNRDTSPAFGAQRVRAIKEDLETTSNHSDMSASRGDNFKSRQALTQKSQARFTYSQIQMGIDESNVTNQFSPDIVQKKYNDSKNQLLVDKSKQNKVLQGDAQKNTIKQKADVNSKINGKVNARLRYFTSQISNIPGPNDVGTSTMAEDLGKDRRDNMVMSDPKFRLRNEYYLSSYYQNMNNNKYKSDFQPGKEYESYKKDVNDKLEHRKTTPFAASQRQKFYHGKTQIY